MEERKDGREGQVKGKRGENHFFSSTSSPGVVALLVAVSEHLLNGTSAHYWPFSAVKLAVDFCHHLVGNNSAKCLSL